MPPCRRDNTLAEPHSPIEQFEIKTIKPLELFGLDVSFTNSAFIMVLVVGVLSLFLIGGTRKSAMVPGRWQITVELAYNFIASMIRDNVGKEGKPYFPFIFTLFLFVLGMNLAGLFPYSFTVTSHIAVTFFMAAFIFIGVTIVGFVKNGAGYLKLFVPPGLPAWLLPIVVIIEVISYCVRPISLSVRLFANMLAGHIMMKVFAGFIISLAALGVVGMAGAVLPFVVTVMLTGLELLVAGLQAYVFTILTCIYLNDAMHPSH
ncbi:MAG: F0F1 ATP synthase subunit A [Kordiimonadaceae bacterium]|nr:F0F1 ATP synthase subunit A [Kordiimonadaceae bacterium]